MSMMHTYPHPGEALRQDVLPALGLSVTAAAAQLGVTRAALSRVLNGRAAISPEMALNPVAQRLFGGVVGKRQMGLGDRAQDHVPVVEEFAHDCLLYTSPSPRD